MGRAFSARLPGQPFTQAFAPGWYIDRAFGPEDMFHCREIPNSIALVFSVAVPFDS
jgi:hypothetical protein